MLNIKYDFQLKGLNTLNLSAVAAYFIEINTQTDLIDALQFAKKESTEVVVLSGGSNMLLPEYLNACVLYINIQGIQCIEEDETDVLVQVGAGQNWHDFVLYSTQQEWYGLQNLALIPGKVGAAPVQNIGAYGVEVGEFISYVSVYDCIEKEFVTLSRNECHFEYRNSIFKQNQKRYIIVSVVFKLKKNVELKLDYGDLATAVGDNKTPMNLQEQVIRIRRSKLPDPKEYPNVGSFFKNPIVSHQQFMQMHEHFPNMPHYTQADGRVKLAAGWLIDQVGWKGKRLGKVGMFAKQALVLVNYADANLEEVKATYTAVQNDVQQKFNILLEPEPIIFEENGLGHL